MTIFKPLLIGSFAMLSLSAFCQTNDSTVFLKWKLKPGEVLTYKTEMKEIDTAKRNDINFNGLARLMGANEKNVDSLGLNKMANDLNKQLQMFDFITRLSEKKKGVVDIELSVANNEEKAKAPTTSDPKKKAVQAMVDMMKTGVMLRGAVYEDGSIASFYTKNDQRNLVSMLFELPAKRIKVGDTWSLDVHLLSADQYFVCDSSFRKNKVTLLNIQNVDGEHIATLKYDIVEYMHGVFNMPTGGAPQTTMMKMTHQAIARFSIEKGRWVFYEGVMSLVSSGLMDSQTTKRLSLVAE